MTVSKTASKIYQAAKLNNKKGVWAWRAEWSKAMKQAWRKVSRKIAWNLQEAKRIAIATARAAQIKINMERNAARLATLTEGEKEQALAQSIYADYQAKWDSGKK